MPLKRSVFEFTYSESIEIMGPRKTSDETRKKVIQKFLQNFSESKISKDLVVSKSSVHRIFVAYKKDGKIERKKGPGRAPKTTEKNERYF